MSSPQSYAPRPARNRTLQDALLDDLREAAPMAVPRPATAPAARAEALTVEVRVTPRSGSAPAVRKPADGTGVVMTAGPVRLRLRGFGRR